MASSEYYPFFHVMHTNAMPVAKKGTIKGVEAYYDYTKAEYREFAEKLTLAVSNTQAQAEVICEMLVIKNEISTVDKAKAIIKEKAGLEDNTLKIITAALADYEYGDLAFIKLANAMGANLPIEEKKLEVNYKKYSDNIHELRGNVQDFGIKIVNKSNRNIEEPYCTNGSFFWWEDAARTKPYPTSILIQNGVIIRNEANHYYDFGTPQSVFIVYKNNKVAMKRVNLATELDYKNIKVAVGGVGLRNTEDSTFKYSPVSEGFKKGYRLQDGKLVDYSDVLRRTNKTVIGYNKNNGKLYLLVVKNATHAELLRIISDNSTGEEYHISASFDGGGSVFENNADAMVVVGDGRYISNIIGFGLSQA